MKKLLLKKMSTAVMKVQCKDQYRFLGKAVVVGQLIIFCLFCSVYFEICMRESYFGLTDHTVL